MGECDCRDDCCLEIVPVTINNITIGGAGLSLALVDVDAQNKQVVITVDEADSFLVNCWFQDASTPAATPSVIAPTTPGTSEFRIVTAADGTYTVNVGNTNPSRTWHFCASLGNGVEITAAITIGA